MPLDKIFREKGFATAKIDWFLAKAKNDKVIVVLLVVLTLSLTLNVGFFKEYHSNAVDNRHYLDSLNILYKKEFKEAVSTSKEDFKFLLQQYEQNNLECEKNKRKIEEINFKYQKLLIDCQTKK